jgi:MFS family permease
MDKPPRTFWQIWNMSFGFLGIQFGWGLQMANMSAIYEYLGARADQIPILWLAAPLTGLIVQPIIGHASDRTWGRLGRRRPYVCRTCSTAWGWKSPAQPGGGEGLEKRKGVVARRGLKEAWIKSASR